MQEATIYILSSATSLYIGVQFQFEHSSYTVSEAAGSLMVCVQLVSGNLSQAINVTIRSQDGTARGTFVIIP